MNAKLIVAASAAAFLCACAHPRHRQPSDASPGPQEVKVPLQETPPAVRKTIEAELHGGTLEDIARTQRDGEAVYETDIIRAGREWELVVNADGRIISNKQEGPADRHAGNDGEAEGWRDQFTGNKARFSPTGDNPWLPVQPGRVLKLSHGTDTLTVSILPETKVIDGAPVGVMEERETRDGELEEVSLNFFATDPATSDVYYFGEDVDNYHGGKVTSHDSAWRSGVDGARFGLMIPGKPRPGMKYYQEVAPGVALDRVEVVSTDETLTVPAGTFRHCLHLRETTPLEPGTSHKWYAPGIGMIKDDEFELLVQP
ncbi:MAG: PepSY domain-containing protein [Phycisphaerales bacterium]